MASVQSSLLAAGLVAVVLALGACGKKGPLYLPEDRPPRTSEPVTAPVAPAAHATRP
jgi:predicted small lipoprotein YifL